MCVQLRTQRALNSMQEMDPKYDRQLQLYSACAQQQTSLYLTCLLTAQENVQLAHSLQRQPARQGCSPWPLHLGWSILALRLSACQIVALSSLM